MTTTTRPMDAAETVAQIGRMNLMSISGLRVTRVNARLVDGRVMVEALRLPVGKGYRVDVLLDASDTYTVRRVFSRRPKGQKYAAPVDTVKGEMEGVYADQLGEVAYRASCFVNVPFPMVGRRGL